MYEPTTAPAAQPIADLIAADCACAPYDQDLPEFHLTLRNKRTNSKQHKCAGKGNSQARDEKNTEERRHAIERHPRQKLITHGVLPSPGGGGGGGGYGGRA
jgi:hypothetical protein